MRGFACCTGAKSEQRSNARGKTGRRSALGAARKLKLTVRHNSKTKKYEARQVQQIQQFGLCIVTPGGWRANPWNGHCARQRDRARETRRARNDDNESQLTHTINRTSASRRGTALSCTPFFNQNLKPCCSARVATCAWVRTAFLSTDMACRPQKLQS